MSTPAEAIEWLDEQISHELNIVRTPTEALGPVTRWRWWLPPPRDGVYDLGEIHLNVSELTGPISIDRDSLRIDLGDKVILIIRQPPEEAAR